MKPESFFFPEQTSYSQQQQTQQQQQQHPVDAAARQIQVQHPTLRHTPPTAPSHLFYSHHSRFFQYQSHHFR